MLERVRRVVVPFDSILGDRVLEFIEGEATAPWRGHR